MPCTCQPHFRIFLCLLVWVTIDAGSGADLSVAQDFWPDVVDTVDVAADRPDALERLRRRAGFATVVPLGVDAPPGRDLGDLLDRTVGLHVHRYGGSGSYSLASVRGSSPGQVTIFLDGVPVATAADGVVNLAAFPVSHLDHAEVYRGPQTLTFGGPPSAGAINLVTPDDLRAPLRLSLGGGGFGLRVTRGQWGGPIGPVGLFLSGEYQKNDGDYEYLYNNGTIFNTEDDQLLKRRNNDVERTSILWKTRLVKSPGLSIDYTGRYLRRANGVPGHKNIRTEHVRFRSDRDRHQLTLLARPSVRLDPWIHLSVHQESIRDRFRNPEGEVGLGRTVTDDRIREVGARITVRPQAFRLAAPVRQEPRVGFEVRRERWTPHNVLNETRGFTRSRTHRTLTAEDVVTLGRWTLEAAYRWAWAADNYSGPIQWGRPPEAAPERVSRHEGPVLGTRFDLGRGLVFKANRSRFSRFPTFPELFGFNGVQDGNPALRPETGKQWDAGFTFGNRDSPRIETAYFEKMVEDQIYLLQNSQRTVKADNLDRAWVRGVESTFFGRWPLPRGARLELQANHTWQEAVDVGKSRTYHGRRIPNLPRNEEYVSTTVTHGPWSLEWELSARSMSFWHRYNQEEQMTPAYAVQDLSMERTVLARRWVVRLSLRNLTDERVEDIDGYPLPGRHLLMDLTWTM